MRCPICHSPETRVTDSRTAIDGWSIRRRRECTKCGFRFSTYEEIELLNIVIIKNDGRQEPYQRNKLIRGLKRAIEKRPISDDQFQRLISRIERDIQKLKQDKVTSRKIGEIVMRHLKRVDEVAYIRFASVYRSFKDLQSFKRELNLLFKTKAKNKN